MIGENKKKDIWKIFEKNADVIKISLKNVFFCHFAVDKFK